MNTLVLGNPGTGKTHNIIEHIRRLISIGYKNSDITVLSHTRVAAKEIVDRAGEKGVNTGTIHAFAYKMADVVKEQVVTTKEIREFSEEIGIPMKGNFGNDSSLENGDEYISVINYAKACKQPYKWAYNIKGMPGTSDEFDYFCANYDSWKKSYGYIDFNDMLDNAMLSDKEQVLPALLIDEAQDLSKSQWELIDKISKNTREMVVTGDPDQCVFGWGGADPHSMVQWAKKNDATIEHLSQSYRVPIKVYKLSRAILEMVKNRYEKNYIPTEVEGEINRFLTPHHYDMGNLDSALILYRNHALRGSIENELIANNKAYTTLNGMRGLCQNKYAIGIKAWLNIYGSEFPSSKDISNVKAIASPAYSYAIANNDLDTIRSMEGIRALDIPGHLISYYRSVNFDEADKIKLSTIHGAKGMGSERVIMINGVTQRVMDEFLINPDPEWLVWYVAVTRSKNMLDIIDGESEGIL